MSLPPGRKSLLQQQLRVVSSASAQDELNSLLASSATDQQSHDYMTYDHIARQVICRGLLHDMQLVLLSAL
jgi:hypothetical protein